MNNCLSHYYKDQEFRKECENIYLDRRTKYRTTGILEKDPYYKKPYYESERKKEFLAKFRAEKAKQTQEETASTQK